MIDAISTNVDVIFSFFNVILYVKNEKRERFDVNDAIVAKMTNEINEFLVCFENVTNLKIEIFEIVLSEIDKIVVVILFLFFIKAKSHRFNYFIR